MASSSRSATISPPVDANRRFEFPILFENTDPSAPEFKRQLVDTLKGAAGHFETIQTTLDGLTADVHTLNTKFDTLQTTVDGLTTQFHTLQATVQGQSKTLERIESLLKKDKPDAPSSASFSREAEISPPISHIQLPDDAAAHLLQHATELDAEYQHTLDHVQQRRSVLRRIIASMTRKKDARR